MSGHASGEMPDSSKWLHNSRRRSSRRAGLGIRAPATMRSINASTASCSRTRVTENGAHGHRNARPLPALRFRPAATLCRQAVVLAWPSRVAVAPARFQQTRALHLVERGIERAFLELKGPGTAALGFLHHLVPVHLTLGQEAQNQHPDRTGQELPV